MSRERLAHRWGERIRAEANLRDTTNDGASANTPIPNRFDFLMFTPPGAGVREPVEGSKEQIRADFTIVLGPRGSRYIVRSGDPPRLGDERERFDPGIE